MKVIYENDYFEIIKTMRDYDFIYVINIKSDKTLKLRLVEEDEIIEINDYLGLFNSEKCIVDEIIKNNYEVI